MNNKDKKVKFDWKTFICGTVNYAFTTAPLFAAALNAQAASGSVASMSAFIAPTVAWLGENVKSVTVSDVEADKNLKESFEEQSKEALYRAWDKVYVTWESELSSIPDGDMDELKKALYEKVFRFDEYSYTAVIDRSPLAADEIGLLITEVLQNRLNAEGTWEDDALNKIAEAVTMNFYVELESEIRKEPILYGQLDIGGIKKRLDAIEEWLKKQCDNENDEAYIRTASGEIKKIIDYYKQNQQESILFLGKVTDISGLIRKNSIRRLSEELWINWKTRVLADDFRSALAYDERLERDTAKSCTKELTESQIRLLSILVQAEGGYVGWDEIDARMALAQIEAGADNNDGSESEEADDSEDEKLTAVEELRYYRSVIPGAIRRNLQNKDEHSTWVATRLRYLEWWIENVFDHLSLEDEKGIRAEEFVKMIRSYNYLDAPRLGNRRRVNAMVGQLCKVSEKLKDLIKKDRSKGYRIELDSYGIGDMEISKDSDLYSFYEQYIPEVGIRFPVDDWDLIQKYSDQSKPEYEMYVQAWQRRYYNGICRSFEKNVSNIRDESGLDADDGDSKGYGFEADGEGEDSQESIFGDYKMSRIYLNAYALEGGEVRTEPAPGVVDPSGTEVMLDYLEKWFKAGDQKGRVLVLHGQPGDGKTTFCKKAVYAYRKEGWLADSASNVFYFNLNTRSSDILTNGLQLAKLLCIDNPNSGKRDFIMPKDLDGALVILDGFDELSSAWSEGNDGQKFNAFCELVGRFVKKDNPYRFKTVITSRTMCIANELRGESFRKKKIPVASFAPMTELQQDAMIDRMIQLDAEAQRAAGGDEIKRIADNAIDKKMDLEEYKAVIAKIREKKNDKEYKYDKLNELLKIPSLFRMIVAQRFDDYEGISTVAELYKKLFGSLLKNRTGDVDEDDLVKKYGNIAARIFSHNDDICPYDYGEVNDKELVYKFFTKNNQQEGRLGFLHRSFYQYFLARFIVAAIKNTKINDGKNGDSRRLLSPETELVIDSGNLHKDPDIIDLMAVLRSRRINDSDMWKLLRQLAEIENGDNGIIGKNGKRNKIRKVLDWLEKRDNISKLIEYERGTDEDDADEEDTNEERKDSKAETDGFLCAENAVFNLIGILAAVEQGCLKSTDKNVHATPYEMYSNICQLLRHGDFSGIYLSGLNLKNCNLQNARLQGADLTGTILEKAKVEGANLSNAVLTNVVLANANPLSAENTKKVGLADDENSDIDESDGTNETKEMSDQDMSRDAYTASTKAFFMGADLDGADLRDANLSGSDFSGATLIEAKLQGVHLEEANLSEADLSDAWFSDGTKHVKDSDTPFKQAHLERADLRSAVLTGSHMEEAVFAGANLRRADLKEAYLDNADFEEACLAETDMTEAHLLGCNMTKADLEGASMVCVRIDSDTKLNSADMRTAFLAGRRKVGDDLLPETNLHDASLKGAKLDGVYISGNQYELLYDSNQSFKDIIDAPKIRFGGKLTVSARDNELEEKKQNILSGFMRTTERTIDMYRREGKIDELVHFGRYPYESNNKSTEPKMWKPLRWRMLRREHDKVLLITEDLIDCKQYHEKYVDITWEKCTLRRWLNEEFIIKAFTDEERTRIAWVCNQNPDNNCFKEVIKGGNPTWDRVFALSIDEVRRYFKNDSDRMAAPTPYVEENYRDKVYISEYYKVKGRGTGWWWLRSPGINSSNAARVSLDGVVNEGGGIVDHSTGSVRPALWLNL